MKRVSMEQVKPEACLARTLYDENGRIILTRGTILNDCYINRLKKLGIQSIYVDENAAGMEIDDVVAREVRVTTVRNTKEALSKLRAGESRENRDVRRVIGDIINEVMHNRELMVHLIDIFSLKDHTFRHSINVAVLSLLTGHGLGYSREQLTELGMGALLHDVGKVTVPDLIINSKDILATEEYRVIQRHAECGYKILVKSEKIPESAADIALQHHERFDGSGYPMGLMGNDISEHARIVAVADVFDALSNDRPYREGILPHDVLMEIRASAGSDFDPQITAVFISALVPFPPGSRVLLNDGCEGIVISVDSEFPARPRVQLTRDNGSEVCGIKITDLLTEKDKFIKEVLRN